MNQIFGIIFSPQFVFSVIRITTPIVFAALGALITSRAGVINIGMEGMMLFAALAGVLVSAWTQSAFLGLIAGLFISFLVALIMSYVMLILRSHITLSGIAVNLGASGATVFILYLACHDKGISSNLASKVLPRIQIPLLEDIPILGEILSGHNVLTYVAMLMVFAVWFTLNKTPLGLRIRAVGEYSDAALSVGVRPVRYQFIAMLISGALAGLGGVYMSMGYVSWFSRDMIAGRGFIALAAQQLGQGTTMGTFASALIFGTADSLANNLQALQIPPEFVQSIPYGATIFGLVIFSIIQRRMAEKRKRIAAGETLKAMEEKANG
jgi:simple sugar transport system permease protein